MEETIDLREYFFILKKKMWIIVLSAVICGVISGLVSFYVLKPVYEANTTLIVNKEVENETTQMTTSDDLNFVQKLALTYGEIIKSRSVITSTIDKLNLDMTYEELSEAVSITNVENTQIIKISVKNENPRVAATICNTIPEIFSTEVQRIVKASGTEVIDKAAVPEEPVKPNKTMNILIAMVLGPMVSVFVIFLRQALNTKIKEPKDIEEKLGLPVFGVVPKF
ncbi:YveK family protein [Terrisporobacter mayombei]|uniref:Capsular polysaccharide biosynthesis protein YwqC n=1 Tax=Terrisporobacter mayombei TaxID=1541 RepID=A0ABY9QAB8_9FIRM|nr:Wzz/FepE/Etk N-terminal domain-containing protein [Terrisporobacter mayombei]MCC3869619.1 lipopolysaccharide biosynthesis protein [Terrisporobacter mayombei]WMT83442.1 putative capsular polysaccharide biosynthesis protein YwqC [Terrisporobacter mayombei]